MNFPAAPKRIAPLVLVLIALLVGAALPASAAAAPEEGNGTLSISPSPTVLETTTAGQQSNPQPVTLTYEGEGMVYIEGLDVVGGEAGEFLLQGSNCGGLGEGASCQVWLGLKPASPGEKHAELVVKFGTRPAATFEISGTAVEPSLGFSPAGHDFGLWRINRETAFENFTVSNTGQALVQVNNDEITGPGHDAFWISGQDCSGRSLAPGESCWVQVAFNPHQRQAYEASLRVWVNGASFDAALAGQGGAARVETPENPVDLGAATVGGTGEVRAITLENTGDLPETFFIGVLAGGDAASFELLDENCTLVSLAPGASCTAHVRFAPRSAGRKAARLAFFGDGEGGTMVQVEGDGVAASASMLPAAFDFGAVAGGARSASHEFVVRNDGPTPLAFDRVSVVGTDVDQFPLSGDECSGAELAPGASCAVRVRFAPEGTGARQATLRVSGASATLSATLAGSAGGAEAEPESETAPRPPRRAARRFRFVHGETLDARRARVLHHRGHRRGGRERRPAR
ncbi:MAG: choice-of-anchor D domain-containing protein [Solirubrobacterales bacterium]